jgi:hypothetical protein
VELSYDRQFYTSTVLHYQFIKNFLSRIGLKIQQLMSTVNAGIININIANVLGKNKAESTLIVSGINTI